MKKHIVLFVIITLAVVTVFFHNLKPTSHHSEQVNKNIQTESGITIEIPATHAMTPTTNTPQSPDGPDSHWFYSESVTIEEDTNITGFNISMNGADPSVLHHVSIGVLGRKANVCTQHYLVDRGAFELFSTSRIVLDPISFPEPYGMPVKAGEVLFVEFMAHPQAQDHIHNHEIQPTLVVNLETDTDREEPITFTRLRLDDSPCTQPLAHQAFVIPTSTDNSIFIKTSQGNEESSSVTFTSSTTIILGGANFWPQKGGQDVTVFLNNQPVKTFTADPTENLTGWNIPLWSENLAVPASSTIKIESSYINPFDTPVLDASGMFGFFHTVAE